MNDDKLKSLLIGPQTTIKQAMHRLNETAEKILFVADQDRNLLGTVTDGDIRRGIINDRGFHDPVETIMRRNYIFVSSAEDDLQNHVKKKMLESGIEQIPVLDTRNRIVDVVLWTDLLEKKTVEASSARHPNQVVIMAGGKGTRMDPFTRILPKPLIPIGDKPIIELIMEKFSHHGFHRFQYTLNYKKEFIKAFLRENQYPYEIGWVEEPDFLGTAGSLALLRDKLTEPFFITNCDSLLVDINFSDILDWHREQQAAITIIGCHNEYKIPFGVLEISDGRLERISEKPVHDVIINTGVYVMEPRVLSLIKDGDKIDMNVLIDAVIKKDKVTVFPIYGNWLDIGQWEEYNKTVKHLKIEVDNV